MSVNRLKEPVSSLPETGSGSPGSILRRCREFHEITLEEASETTKIGISHLKALEDDQIGEFANQAYLKGFLRIYATYLGLNSEDIARMYTKLFGGQAEKSDPAGISPPGNRPKRRLISLKKLTFPALLLALILITATFLIAPRLLWFVKRKRLRLLFLRCRMPPSRTCKAPHAPREERRRFPSLRWKNRRLKGPLLKRECRRSGLWLWPKGLSLK